MQNFATSRLTGGVTQQPLVKSNKKAKFLSAALFGFESTARKLLSAKTRWRCCNTLSPTHLHALETFERGAGSVQRETCNGFCTEIVFLLSWGPPILRSAKSLQTKFSSLVMDPSLSVSFFGTSFQCFKALKFRPFSYSNLFSRLWCV